MSKEGVKLAASIFSAMQEARGELLSIAAKQDHSSKDAHQDILLAQMMETAKDAIKNDFMRIIR